MDCLQTAFSGKQEQNLTTHDKHLLANNKDKVLADLENLKLTLLNPEKNFSKSGRMKLVKVIYLSKILGFKKSDAVEDRGIVKELEGSNLLPTDLRHKNMQYIEYLVNNLKLASDSGDLPFEFKAKLKMSEFDQLMKTEDFGIKDNVLESFNMNGVWKTQPVFEKQRMKVWGSLSKPEFLKAANLNPMVIDYIQQQRPKEDCRTDSKDFNSAVSLLTIDSTLISYRDFLPKDVSDMLQKIRNEHELDDELETLAAGLILKRRNDKYYFATTARVIFPELNKIDLSNPELQLFNKKVTFAEYSAENDVAIVQLKQAVANGFSLASRDERTDHLRRLNVRNLEIRFECGLVYCLLKGLDIVFKKANLGQPEDYAVVSVEANV